MSVLREPYRLRVSDVPGIAEQRGSQLSPAPAEGHAPAVAIPKRFARVPRVEPVDVRTFLMKQGYAFPRQAQVMSVLMCKGGVGKTSTAFYVGLRMSMYGARVLLIDADPQGNLTGAFRLDEMNCSLDEDSAVLLDVVEERCKVQEAIISVTPQLHLLPSTPLNSVLDARLRDKFKNPALPIRRILEPLREDYDFILIDCAPALNLTNTAIIGASQTVVLPVGPDLFSYMGLKQTLKELGQIEADFDLTLTKKIVPTKFDARETTSRSYAAKLESEFSKHLCQTRIRSSSDIRNAVHQGQDLFDMNQSHGKTDYDDLTLELMGAAPFLRSEEVTV